MMYILGKRTTSANALFQELKTRRQVSFIRERRAHRYSPHGALIYRWGSVIYPEWDEHNRVINTAQAIRHNSHKLKFLNDLKQRGINVPETVDLDTVSEEDFPIYGRNIYHTQGRDIYVIETEDDIDNAPDRDYYIKFIPNTLEYRVHFWKYHGVKQIIRVTKKIERDDTANPWIKNDKNNWRHIRTDKEQIGEKRYRKIENLMMAVLDYTELNLGAADILYSLDEYKPYVTELNSAPGLSELGVQEYAQILARL